MKEQASPKRGRLLLEQLEQRQMMAGDVDLWSTSPYEDLQTNNSKLSAYFATTVPEAESTTPEGESAPDLVAFARALSDAGVTMYGAAWCPVCTEQKQLFGDGADYLNFVESSNADRTVNTVGQAAGITQFPTWDFPDGTRQTGLVSLATLSQRSGVAIPQSASPRFAVIPSQNVPVGSPLHIPVNASNPAGGPVTITVSVANPDLLEAVVLTGNRSIRMSVAGYGDMVFELFEDKAPRPTGRVIQLAEDGFYDGTIFHRIINDFMIQGGDPTGTGTGGSQLGNFDDQFHPDLQHNRSGMLSFAKSSDDTNNSQFFITDGPTRHLDYNHSVFGILTEGDKVREAINNIANPADRGTNASDKPLINIVLDSVTVFNDTQNSVVMFKAKGNQTGTTNVTITATNASGETFTQVVPVSVVADTASGGNSQPYLNDIPTPAPFPNTAPATLQLSSVDVEGDAVQYFVSTSNTNVTATVNATTGLVTVTPNSGFVGTANVLVGVRPGANVSGQLGDQSDTQLVPFTFTSSQALAAPTGVSLASASDTGSSNSDRITRSGSLAFNISGVQSGAEVVLYAGTTEVGRGLASGTTIAITTNNIAALGDGSYQITARQIKDGQTSAASPAITVVYDATQPVRVQNFPTNANVGVLLNVNLTHPEEGTGLVYGLTGAPTGLTINASTGVINWTPTAGQVGSHTVTLTLTDPAGNIRSEQFTLAVAEAPLAEMKLKLTDLNGNAITQVQLNQEFLLHFYASDSARPINRTGIFAAYIDVTFDSTKVAPVTTTPIVYGSRFDSQGGSGSFSNGLIDELGAFSSSTTGSGDAEQLVATVRMRATGAGQVTFVSDPADISGNDVLLYDLDEAVPHSRITYGRAELTVGSRFSAGNDTYTVAKGAAATNFNVLANDQFAAGQTGTLTLSSLGTPSAGGTVSIVNNQVRYQPLASYSGTETFTYTVADNTGLTQTATVTVTVTNGQANAPTLVADTFTVTEDAAIATFNVLSNDTPAASGGTLRVSAVGTSANGSTVEIATDGAGIRYKPAANFNGTETITYTVTDSAGGTASSTVTFTVTAVNDAPPAANITRNFFRGHTDTVVAALADYGTNVDGNEALTVAIVGTPTGGGTFRVDGTSIRYTPPNSTFTGTVTVQYRTTDPGGLSSTGTITLNVLDSLPTNLTLQLVQSGGSVAFGSGFVATLTGTTSGGQTVNRTVPLSTTNTSVAFNDLAAGSYVVRVPALPFLTGMTQPQEIAVTAAAAGGTVNESIQLGSLDPSHMRISDFFRSASKDKLFAVVQPGSNAAAVVGTGNTVLVKSPVVNLNAAGTTVTVTGTNASNAATQTTLTTASGRIQTRATDSGYRLLRLNLTGATFAPPTTPANGANGNGQAEGESSAQDNDVLAAAAAEQANEEARRSQQSQLSPDAVDDVWASY